jgi:hypothetical protein
MSEILETEDKPLVVGVARARILLDTGLDSIYDLIKAGELDSYLEGRRRKITVASIERLIRKRLAANGGVFRRGKCPEQIRTGVEQAAEDDLDIKPWVKLGRVTRRLKIRPSTK